MIREINSTDNNHIKTLIKLKNGAKIIEDAKFLVEGWNIIKEALNTLAVVEIITTKEQQDYFITTAPTIPLTIVSEHVANKLKGSVNSQNIFAVLDLNKLKNYNYLDFNTDMLILENVQDPGNMGALLRTALGFNFNNILILGDSVSIFNEKVLRASQGAFLKLNLKVIKTNYLSVLQELATTQAYYLISTGLNQRAVYLDQYSFITKQKIALMFGNEGNGLSSELLTMSQLNLKININPQLESLNVSQASAIIMYEINKQKGGSNV
ncbi:TrmH family RNA methyltransferase [Spiroplasma chrysopicola]|uniref:RNA methyltransferase, TrmH family n=1 Tax=Spiroplasma chrysopicola DF-1 TaxID=1276227 RepID=R4U0T5_9MOLU|nr:RNA methyltransferase [Spiroplasma chrysopicola]AGM24897.1 RNA methyltransferase, TrmH family [Spiroplasma chrysopicola DF-1]